MAAVEAGTNLVDVGNDPVSAAWNATDLMLRMITHTPIPAADKYSTVVRAFTKSNIASVSLTNSAFQSGTWYSNRSFEAMYGRLWSSAG